MADERCPEAIRHPRWLIIGGAPRSGTTLLYNLLKKSPFLALKNERNLFEQALRDGESSAARDYLKLLTGAQLQRVPYLGEKRPEYFGFPLQRCFPSGEVSIIHISRRPRDAIGSMMARTQRARRGEDDRWSRFFRYADAVDAWLSAWQFAVGQSGSARFLHLKYEDLVADPDRLLESLQGWLGIDDGHLSTSSVAPPTVYPDFAGNSGRRREWRIRAIDDDWALPLLEIEHRHADARPPRFRSLRRLQRRMLWWYSVGSKRV